ncbi:TPA: hypothetical protein SMI94_002561 [Klebsiella oxytoca]|nr:hypothetical protein [Klebsiella oxytoca]
MTSKLTRERIEWLNYAATGLAANGTEMAMSPQDVIALTECCMAAMDSDPVAWIVHARTGDQLTTDGSYVANAEGILGLHSTPLYRNAQPAPSARMVVIPTIWKHYTAAKTAIIYEKVMTDAGIKWRSIND